MTTAKHRSLVERGGRKALLEILHTQQKKMSKNPIFTNLKKRFQYIELPAKLLDHFLRGNKSNINQNPQHPPEKVTFLLKNNSGYPKDKGDKLLKIANPGNPLRHNSPGSALIVSILTHSRGPRKRSHSPVSRTRT